jgi:hypothetical protein
MTISIVLCFGLPECKYVFIYLFIFVTNKKIEYINALYI